MKTRTVVITVLILLSALASGISVSHTASVKKAAMTEKTYATEGAKILHVGMGENQPL
jgi:hypothetical protein